VTGVPTGASDDTSPAVSISDDSPDTAGYRCALTGPDGTIPVTVCGPNATLDLTGTPDGLITLTVSAVDAAGNVSASTTKTWTLDTTAPAAPRVKGVTLGNSRTVSVKLRESESDVSYTCTPTGAQPVTVDTCGPTTTFTIGGGSADGVFRLVVAATDAAGNTSRTTTFAYRLDTTPPPSPLVRRRPASLTNDASPRMRISDQEAGVTLSCRLDGPGGQVWSGDCPPDGTVPTEGAGDGAYAFTVTATDPAGNAAHTTVRWTLDTTPPAAPQVRRVAGSGSSGNATTVSFAVTASDSADTLSCVATDPQGRPVPVSVSLSGGTGTCAMDLTGETAQGRYTLRVTETDAAGNASSDTGTYDYDTLPPALPRLTLGQASVGRSRTPDWQIHAGSGDRTFRCVLTDDSSGAILTQGACSAQFSPAQPLPGRSGRFTLAVVAADAAGNLTSPVTSTYRLDRVPPAAPAATISGSPDHVTSSGLVVSSDPRPSVSIHQLTGLHYTCEVSAPGGGFVPVSSCAQPLAGVSVTTPTDTLYVVRVIAVDAAGNQRFTDLRYELLTIPPAAPIITQHPSGDTPLRRSSFAWTTAHGDTSICTIVHGTAQQPGQVVVGPVIGCHPGWTVSLPKGTYTFEVRLDDGVGNVSAPATATFTVDPSATLPPVIHGPKSPGRVTHPHFTVKAPPGTTRLSCLLTENGRVIYRGDCPPNNRFDLSKRPDGVFVLTVVAHLPNGVTSSSSIGYILDRRPPARPTLVSRPHATGHGGKVDWNFLLPAGTSGECTLLLDGRPVVGPVTCRDMASYALSRLHGDGRFTFKVVAIDAAGNHSSPLEVAYDGSAVGQVAAVSMPSPSVRLLTHANGRTTWAINDSVGSRFFCRVTHNGVVVVGERSCSSEFTTDLAGQPAGEYLLHVFAVSRVGGIVSPTSTAAFSWAGVPSGQTQSAPVPTRPQHRPSKPAPVNRAPAHPIVTTPNRGGPARPQPSPPKQPAKHPGPSPVPSKLVPGVSRQIADGVQSVVSNIGSAGGGAGFPLLLVLGVGLFLLVQNRIDRQDPKLALAAVGDDDFVEFILPPSHDGDREQW
jgi:hypothetical protein